MENNIFEIFNIKSNNIEPAKGRILISEPFLDESIFKRSVVLLVDYSQKGAYGLVLNKFYVSPEIIDAVKKDFLGANIDISSGGPVGLDEISFIYQSKEKLVNKSVEVLPGLYYGGDYEHLRELVITEILKPHKVRIFSGYSGWVANQLDTELKADYWLVKNITVKEVMNIDKNIWKNQLIQLEEKYKRWTLIPEDPLLN